MAIQTQFRRGNTYSHSLFTGASGEITVDLDKKVAVVHDGASVGGFPLALASFQVLHTIRQILLLLLLGLLTQQPTLI